MSREEARQAALLLAVERLSCQQPRSGGWGCGSWPRAARQAALPSAVAQQQALRGRACLPQREGAATWHSPVLYRYESKVIFCT